MRATALLVISVLVWLPATASAQRVKDMTSIAGVRSNQLLGYGLVIGLDGTGDQTAQTFFTGQSMKNMLNRLGVAIPEGTSLDLKNVAAVLVQADLPAFTKVGQTLDVTVSSIGNAKSLRGGALVMTMLRGVDNQVYAVAQGNLIVGGFGAEGSDGSSVSVNSTSTGRIPNGGLVERAVSNGFGQGSHIQLNLHSPDFTTAQRLVNRINQFADHAIATALDSVSVQVVVPTDRFRRVEFISQLENLEFDPGESAARIIVNSRTGTVVIGRHVRVLPAAVSHGKLTVSITEAQGVSQPAPFARKGESVVLQDSEVSITQENNPMFLFEPGASLQDLVRAVNEVGASPGDLVSILEALEEVGALEGQLVVM